VLSLWTARNIYGVCLPIVVYGVYVYRYMSIGILDSTVHVILFAFGSETLHCIDVLINKDNVQHFSLQGVGLRTPGSQTQGDPGSDQAYPCSIILCCLNYNSADHNIVFLYHDSHFSFLLVLFT